MEVMTLTQLKALVTDGDVKELTAHVQVDVVVSKSTKEGKPYCEVRFVDAADHVLLRAWGDTPMHAVCVALAKGDCVEVCGEFSRHATFGLEARRWTLRSLSDEEKSALVAGPAETRRQQEADFHCIAEMVQTMNDPRLRILCETFLVENGERFRRAAGARSFHHARRGGLIEHTAQMMRAAVALTGVYPRLNRDLLLAGVLFHDAGKLWENHIAEDGFAIEHSERGEMLGHINIGIEIVNKLWRQLKANDAFTEWKVIEPASETVRLHLLHLVASHHGELAFGSPVVPKTPEACALHYIDNLDAKMEMVFGAYGTAAQVAPNIFDRVRPLPGFLVKQLKPYPADADPAQGLMAFEVGG